MHARSLARMLVIAALACAGLFLFAGLASAQDPTTVQNRNTSTDSSARSAPATAGNTATMQSGPSARNGADAAMVGDTSTTVSQDNSAASGPASAGSQFSNPGSGSVEQNNNTSNGATARSGPVTSFNSADVHNGPYASGNGASASMVGDGNLDVAQTSAGASGAADAAVQRTRSSDSVVQNSNSCGDAVTAGGCGLATSGPVAVSNTLRPIAGVPSGTGPVAVARGRGDTATADLVGDADAVITQRAVGTSGDATLGSQDVDVSGATVQNRNRTENGRARSGPVTAATIGAAIVGPFAHASSSASSVQVGDASGDLDQDVRASSGDAVVGSQVVEARGDRAGALKVQNRSASEDDTAVTGLADARSDVVAFAGPVGITDGSRGATADATLNGDASFDIATRNRADSGDAITGSQFTKARGTGVVQNRNESSANRSRSGDALAGDVIRAFAGPFAGLGKAPTFARGVIPVVGAGNATATQDGDAEINGLFRATASSGDAVTGTQGTQAIDSTVQNRNEASDSTARSATACASPSCTGTIRDATGGTATVPGGNQALLFAGPVAGGPGTADATLDGDAEATLRQIAGASSGDALASSQTTRARDSIVQNRNTSTGAVAGCFCSAVAGNIAQGVAGPLAFARRGETASSTQVGDAVIDAGSSQISRAEVGATTAGSQDTTATNGATVQNRNRARDATAVARGATSFNALGSDPFRANSARLLAVAGPVALALTGDANATLDGDAELIVDQIAFSGSGDAVTGSQLARLSGGTSQLRNTSDGDFAASGPAGAFNIGGGVVGPRARNADATQVGDDTGVIDTSAEAISGDVCAGSQFITGSGVRRCHDATATGLGILSSAGADDGDGFGFGGADDGISFSGGSFVGGGVGGQLA